MYCLVFAVVAPCLGPELHVIVPMCMPHQMPTYFIGLIQSVCAMTLGGFKFSPMTEGDNSVTLSAIWMVRHGVTNGVCPRTFTLSSVLTGPDDHSCSERSSRGRLEAIHHARALSAIANSVSSSVISKSPRPACAGNS